jgi:hypothetical protein
MLPSVAFWYKMHLMFYRIVTALVFWCVSLPVLAEPNWQTDGESLHYNIYWSFIKAGEASITYQPAKDNGYTIRSNAWTTSGVRSLFTLKDIITVTGKHTNSMGFLPEKYDLKLSENDYRADKNVRYNRGNREAIYTNIWGKQKPRSFSITTETRDMISALYFLRATQSSAKVGDVFSLPVFDLDKSYLMDVKIIGKEILEINKQEIDTLHIQPVLHGVSDKRTTDKWHIWATNDGSFTPVKIAVEMKVGGFKAVLDKRWVGGHETKLHKGKAMRTNNPLTGF